MKKFLQHAPAVAIGIAASVYFVCRAPIDTAAGSIISFGALLLILGYAVALRAIPHPKQWEISQWLLAAFCFVVLLSVALSDSPLHGLIGSAFDMTSALFLVGAALAALCISAFSNRSRQTILFVSGTVLLFLLLYPTVRSEVSVRPSLAVTLQVETAVYKESGSRAFLVGSGPSSFVYMWQTYRPREVMQTPFWNEDFSVGSGIIPTLWVEVGLVAGLLLIILFFVAATEEAVRLFRLRGSVKETGFSIVGLILLLTSFSMLLFAEPSAPLVLVALCVFGSFRRDPLASVTLPPWLRRFLFGLIACMAFAVLYIALAAGFYFYSFSKAAGGDLLRARTAGEYAYTLFPNGQTGRLLVQVLRATGHEIAGRDVPKGEVVAVLQAASLYARKGTEVEPMHVQNWKLRGISLAEELALKPEESIFNEAVAAFEHASKLSPLDPSVYYFKAQAYVLAGKRKEARDILEKGLLLKPDYAAAQELLDALPKK